MRRAIALLAVGTMVASCGQRSGIHAQFEAQFREVVATSTTAHGASARTRHVTRLRHLDIRPQPVPGGRQILVVKTTTTTSGGVPVVTWPQWAALLLPRLRAPTCANNLIVVVAWAAQEGSQAGWNPLDTTFAMPGATLFNSTGVRNYVSLAEGLDATILTLQGGWQAHGYAAIVGDLRACADPLVTASAINASDWCRGCFGGAYVLAVVPRVIAAYVSSLRPGGST